MVYGQKKDVMLSDVTAKKNTLTTIDELREATKDLPYDERLKVINDKLAADFKAAGIDVDGDDFYVRCADGKFSANGGLVYIFWTAKDAQEHADSIGGGTVVKVTDEVEEELEQQLDAMDAFERLPIPEGGITIVPDGYEEE